ncbi:hypothetical protein D8Y20_11095 [Mariprofundus sp. EBB-1]|uniref:hypothetical protein n=1 Tax=Mariprofundus sp. EBB-1 TaxID=2650971 RepID=UPI000EF17998|nr:hypothetical protein [Mariprofundus sp. EBB-1]RLL50725.1 hypothetical protein D8Y20_11095 [Mariprofundus sp. EBB-1]
MDLIFIVIANDEGLIMADVGEAPGEDFAPFSSTLIETARQMSQAGELGDPVCNAIVLKKGRMLIMAEASIGGESIYISILCRKIPSGVQNLIKRIVDFMSETLLGNH